MHMTRAFTPLKSTREAGVRPVPDTETTSVPLNVEYQYIFLRYIDIIQLL